jgi:hypothetical protein
MISESHKSVILFPKNGGIFYSRKIEQTSVGAANNAFAIFLV